MTEADKIRIKRLSVRHPDVTFTIEPGRGQTYVSGAPTLYYHHEYEEGSVLAGQTARCYYMPFPSVEEAKAFETAFRAEFPNIELTVDGFSTFVPVEVVLDRAGLVPEE